jgi:hypothetical protein
MCLSLSFVIYEACMVPVATPGLLWGWGARHSPWFWCVVSTQELCKAGRKKITGLSVPGVGESELKINT